MACGAVSLLFFLFNCVVIITAVCNVYECCCVRRKKKSFRKNYEVLMHLYKKQIQIFRVRSFPER